MRFGFTQIVASPECFDDDLWEFYKDIFDDKREIPGSPQPPLFFHPYNDCSPQLMFSEEDSSVVDANSRSPMYELSDSILNPIFDHYEVLVELPKPLPHPTDYSFSEAAVLFCETGVTKRVFIIDTKSGGLYYLFTEPQQEYNHGYAASQGILYFFEGSCFEHHPDSIREFTINEWCRLKEEEEEEDEDEDEDEEEDDESGSGDGNKVDVLWDKAKAKVVADLPRQEVMAYNLKTRTWELNTKLNGPKRSPIVFVFDGKIYALAQCPELIGMTPLFEFLDANQGTWYVLPDPPFQVVTGTHILDKERGYLFLMSTRSDTPAVSKFDLKSQKWYNYVIKSDAGLDHFSPGWCPSQLVQGLNSCIVDNIMFCYYSGDRFGCRPVIIFYDWDISHDLDLDCDEENISEDHMIYLDSALQGKVHGELSYGFLNHLGDLRFSLVINCPTRPHYMTHLVCCSTFKLVPENIKNHVPKVPKLPAFKAEAICCRVFQMPNVIITEHCMIMEG